jgi:hypothetical protein
MSCFGVASALDGGRQSVVTYGTRYSTIGMRVSNSLRRPALLYQRACKRDKLHRFAVAAAQLDTPTSCQTGRANQTLRASQSW